MRVGLISDIHANRVALDAVLRDMPSVDHLVCAGDVVGYNPWPAECVEIVRERELPTVMGNHDRAVASDTAFRFNAMAKAGVEHSRRELSDNQLGWLAGLPEERTVLDGNVKIVHGHPDDPDHYTYPDEFSPELFDNEVLLVLGHTHVQAHATYEEGIVCNPGAVGQPRDGDSRGAYAIVDLDRMEVEERRVEYDIEKVVETVEAAGLPRKIGTRLREGR
ncbi:MAG: metallophosphoesterase family protein [Euryarchaeota archaeon]|jgi:putative phosphoesterase|nr:metallophosphoesterase family protein [Euryarchaeota archaeon]